MSSYPGILKGDDAINESQPTIIKYLERVGNIPGHHEHSVIKKHVEEILKAHLMKERLLTYGKGSLIMKEELSRFEDRGN